MHNTKSLEEYVSDIQQKIQTKNYVIKYTFSSQKKVNLMLEV